MKKVLTISIITGLLVASNLFCWYSQHRAKQKFEAFCELLNSDELDMFAKQTTLIDLTNLDVTQLSYYQPNDMVYVHDLDNPNPDKKVYQMSFESLFQNAYASPSQYRFKKYSKLYRYPINISIWSIFTIPTLKFKQVPVFEYIGNPNTKMI